MFKLNPLTSFFLPFILLLLCSCNPVIEDPAVDYKQVIENNSDFNLLLITSRFDDVDSVIIPMEEEYILLDITGIGTIKGYRDCDTNNSGTLSLEVESSDSLAVNIDPNQSSNWQFTIFEEYDNGGGVGECRLVIDNEDIK